MAAPFEPYEVGGHWYFTVPLRGIRGGFASRELAASFAAEFMGGALTDDVGNAAGAQRHALESLSRERAARRSAEPLPEGGLFDEVRRNTRDLFNPEA